MEFPNQLRYTEEHEWVEIQGKVVVVGITDYAQSELGDIVFVELPEAGIEVEAGKSFGTIEAVKTVSELYSPVTGKIVEVNTELADEPERVNRSPYADGWMVKIEFTDDAQLEGLLDAEGYRHHIGEGH
jgi:glycine cleavage system H protein